MNVESRLRELIGPAAGRLHTARSRNDQVAIDFRLWVRGQCDAAVDGARRRCMRRCSSTRPRPGRTVMPGFTHLQPAQPVTFGHHLMAYVEMFGRDGGRFADARARMNESPLGAAALAGTTFPIDREMTAEALGFDRPMANSLDAVGDRDFALEFLAAAAICATHLSRLAEEIVIWTTPQFGFVRLSRPLHHRLLDHAAEEEPRRRRAGPRQGRADHRVARRAADGDEGPAAGLFQGHAGGQGAGLRRRRRADAGARGDDRHGRRPGARAGAAAGGGGRGLLDRHRPRRLAGAASSACRSARRTTSPARWSRRPRSAGVDLPELPLDEMRAAHPGITEAVYDVLGVDNSVASRTSYGGTAPAQVRAQAARWRERLA